MRDTPRCRVTSKVKSRHLLAYNGNCDSSIKRTPRERVRVTKNEPSFLREEDVPMKGRNKERTPHTYCSRLPVCVYTLDLLSEESVILIIISPCSYLRSFLAFSFSSLPLARALSASYERCKCLAESTKTKQKRSAIDLESMSLASRPMNIDSVFLAVAASTLTAAMRPCEDVLSREDHRTRLLLRWLMQQQPRDPLRGIRA